MKETRKILTILIVMLLGLYMSSCKKDTVSATSTTTYSIRMTDAPAPFDAVYIDLQGVEITGNNGNTVLINVQTGIYNLLDFSNGVDTLIATGLLETTTVQQIRLILGSNNSVVLNGVSFPLSTPSAEQSGLKLQVHQILQAGVQYNVLIDFDANKSVILQGNGTYKLKPVLRTIETAISGAIRGKISPVGTLAIVTATSGIAYSSNVNANGDFLIMGLPAGTYEVTVTPALPLNSVIQNNITVTTGFTTNIGTIVL